jgi:hypothetical protein
MRTCGGIGEEIYIHNNNNNNNNSDKSKEAGSCS